MPGPSYDISNTQNLELLKEPDTKPISQEQLVAEVKGIYAGLVMVESKCIEIDDGFSLADRQAKLTNDHWQAQGALHPALLNERHDFFLPSQYLSASVNPNKLASKYAARVRRFNQLQRRFHCGHRNATIWGNFLQLSSHMTALLRKAGGFFENAKEDLLIVFSEVDVLFDVLYLWFQTTYFQQLVYLLLFLVFFSDFPNGIRYLCTTMPWTIWPALAVLWGVCWMFDPPTGAAESHGFDATPATGLELPMPTWEQIG